ncbi:MAG: hypothetical protein ABR554_02965 [Pyrinomonadaceae bacterium]
MKLRALIFGRALALSALCAAVSVGVVAAQGQPGKGAAAPQAPEAEMKAAQTVQNAPDTNAAIVAADAFVKKYPKSTLRPQLLRLVAGRIEEERDAAQRATLSENFLKTFNSPAEANIIKPVLVQSYVAAKRLDDAYRVADPSAVDQFEDPLAMLITLTMTGAQEGQQKNTKYVQQSQQLGMKAIEILEADRKPADTDAAAWGEYKAKWLPLVYHYLAVMSYTTGNSADAKAKIEKAAALNSTDPFTYLLRGRIADEEYEQLANQHKAASGAAKDELLKKALAQMDMVVDAYAHAVALTEGDARYEQLRAQLMPLLENYYKFLNKGSTDGMKKLIDKYKKPATTP